MVPLEENCHLFPVGHLAVTYLLESQFPSLLNKDSNTYIRELLTEAKEAITIQKSTM